MAWKTTLALLVLLVCLTNAYTQNVTAFELSEYLSQTTNNKPLLQSQKTKLTETPLQVLAYDLISTVFIENEEINIFDEQSPLKVEAAYNSFESLTHSNALFNKVELLVIKLDSPQQLNSALDFSRLANFENLKYVYFVCPFNCSSSQIEKIVQGLPSKLILLYSASIPE